MMKFDSPGSRISWILALPRKPFLSHVRPSLLNDVQLISPSERLIQKLGPERAALARVRLQKIGKEEGIAFTSNGWVGDTKPSHLLLGLAGTKGSALQNAVAESIFRAQFEEGRDISKQDTVVEVSVQVWTERRLGSG
jgi:predicted DsbA family dithiol-disulfide isomerase